MKTHRIRYKIIGLGNKCPKCLKEMERRGHNERPKKTWYYEMWDYCKDCKHVQHYDDFKSLAWQEDERREQFLRDI